MPPPSWTDLEARFRALQRTLEPTRQWFRIDYQWGSAGEHWSVVASGSNAAKAEFETLCTIAGDRLLTLPVTAVAPEALAETKAKHRWYLVLWHHMTAKVPDHKAFAGPDDKIGAVLTGRIRQPVELSATLCLQLSTIVVEPAASAGVALAKFKETSLGKFLWWFGEEPLRKLLGSLVVAGVLAAITPIRHAVAALIAWIVSRFWAR